MQTHKHQPIDRPGITQHPQIPGQRRWEEESVMGPVIYTSQAIDAQDDVGLSFNYSTVSAFTPDDTDTPEGQGTAANG